MGAGKGQEELGQGRGLMEGVQWGRGWGQQGMGSSCGPPARALSSWALKTSKDGDSRVQLRVGLCSLWVPLRSLSIHAGSLSQLLGFTLTVPQSVSVQEGLCVLVPCNFKYPASYDTKNSPARLYRYWYKDPADVGRNPPVASSDPSRLVTQETQGRFRLAENPARGDCSVQISDARQTDAGRYFLRVEGDFKYTYRTSADGTDLTLTISVPGTLLAGEPVTVTCTAPGRCSGTPPRVTWMGPFSDTARNVSAQLANGTWAHSSALSFTPTPGKHGKELVCSVTYRPPWGPSTRCAGQWGGDGSGTDLCNGDLLPWKGDSLNLSCEASSRPEATLSWAKGNESLSPGQGGAGHLELPNLSRGDAGEYRCWAKNSYGSASRALRVHVQSKVLGGACATQRGLSGGYWAAGGRWSVGGAVLQGVVTSPPSPWYVPAGSRGPSPPALPTPPLLFPPPTSSPSHPLNESMNISQAFTRAPDPPTRCKKYTPATSLGSPNCMGSAPACRKCTSSLRSHSEGRTCSECIHVHSQSARD
uniref:Ig-like domain-containing protein n=1 Tax=Chrysemys picta bellii TaxID=8478 RepID=A0A8C3PA89_CHRPI